MCFSFATLKSMRKGKLDEASLRLAAQLPISHEKLDTIEDEIEMTSLTPNLFTSSREILCSCVACSSLLSRDYLVASSSRYQQGKQGCPLECGFDVSTHFPIKLVYLDRISGQKYLLKMSITFSISCPMTSFFLFFFFFFIIAQSYYLCFGTIFCG